MGTGQLARETAPETLLHPGHVALHPPPHQRAQLPLQPGHGGDGGGAAPAADQAGEEALPALQHPVPASDRDGGLQAALLLAELQTLYLSGTTAGPEQHGPEFLCI